MQTGRGTRLTAPFRSRSDTLEDAGLPAVESCSCGTCSLASMAWDEVLSKLESGDEAAVPLPRRSLATRHSGHLKSPSRLTCNCQERGEQGEIKGCQAEEGESIPHGAVLSGKYYKPHVRSLAKVDPSEIDDEKAKAQTVFLQIALL